MGTLKGTYRFNDVLSLPSGSKIQQNINFSVTTTPQRAGVKCLFMGSAIVYHNDIVDYHIEASYPDDWLDGMAVLPSDFNVYWEEWQTDILGEGIKTVTIPYEQEVSDDFFALFVANTIKLPDATMTYKGEILETLNGGEYAIIHTKGEVMEDDIRVDVSETTVYIPVNEDSSLPIEVSTEAEMTALLETAEVGSIYKYTGETTDKYENGTKYELCEE